MRLFFPMLCAAAFFTACNNTPNTTVASASTTPKNTDLAQYNLQGKVETITETTYPVDSTGKTGKMDSVISVTNFDAKGYLSKYYQKDSTGRIHVEQTITHYDNGLLKEATVSKDGKQTFKLMADEDKDGHLTGAKTYDSTGKQDGYYKDLQVNDDGFIYGGKHYGMNDKLKQGFTYKYDKAINIGYTGTDSTGKTTSESTIKLNDKRFPVEETRTTRQKDSTKTETITYQYNSFDDKGNWTEQTTYNEKGKPTKITKRTFTYYKD